MSIHQQDIDLLSRMTMVRDFSPEFVTEYRRHLLRRHASGTGSCVGFELLSMLCEKHGLSAQQSEVPEGIVAGAERLDWRTIEPGERVVCILDNGSEIRGEFCGLPSAGTISVRPDDPEIWVQEVPMRKAWLETPDVDELTANVDLSKIADSEPPSAAAENFNGDDKLSGPRWSLLDAGTPVGVLVGDDIVDGEFCCIAKSAGCLEVEIGGKRHIVNSSDVIYESEK